MLLREKIECLQKSIDTLEVSITDLVEEIIEIAGCEYYMMEKIIAKDDIDNYIENLLKNSGWQSVVIALSKINYLNDDYYLINGYGHLEEITIEYVKCLLDDLVSNLDEYLDYEY